ncbi:hypothetical protein N894_1269 [Francisella tularensis subsp. novicida PA10-7858]|nr:hypothetical protein N894_1269 [Francisella tularensis subsp. novicida PA10-7858]
MTRESQLKANKKYIAKKRKTLTLNLYEKDWELLNKFSKIDAISNADKFRLLIQTYFNNNSCK